MSVFEQKITFSRYSICRLGVIPILHNYLFDDPGGTYLPHPLPHTETSYPKGGTPLPHPQSHTEISYPKWVPGGFLVFSPPQAEKLEDILYVFSRKMYQKSFRNVFPDVGSPVPPTSYRDLIPHGGYPPIPPPTSY